MQVLKKGAAFAGRLWKPLLALTLAALLSLGTVNAAFAASPAAGVGDDDAPSLYDFYSLTSIASSVLSNAVGDPKAHIWGNTGIFGEDIPVNGAGALLGFCDDKKVRGINILSIVTSTASAEYSYKTLIPEFGVGAAGSAFVSPSSSNSLPVFAPYVVLGATLADMGLDKTETWKSTMGSLFRLLSGMAIMVIYMISSVVPSIFRVIIAMLKAVNPFQFFSGFNNGAYSQLAGSSTPAFAGIVNFVSDWFAVLYDMSGVILVFMLVILILQVLFSARARRSASTYRKFLTRGLFIFVGIPILGMAYTQVLDWVDSTYAAGNTMSAYVIASTFCDMEAFVTPSQTNNGMNGLSQTITFDYNTETGEVSVAPTVDVQTVCRAVNASGNASLPQEWRGSDNGLVDMSGVGDLVRSMQTSQTNSSNGPAAGFDNPADVHSWILSVLSRYMHSETISAATYASSWMSMHWLNHANDSAEGKKHMEELQDFIQHHTNPKAYGKNGKLFTDPKGLSALSADMNPFAPTLPGASIRASGTTTSGGVQRRSMNFGMYMPSALSVYNYLNTDFGSSKLTVFSSERASSTASRAFHYSVNLAGSGINSLAMFTMAVMVLSLDAILGLCYAFGIVMNNLRRGIHLIASVPMAMLGSLQAIARIITYTVVMILEVLGTMIAYQLLSMLVFSVTYELIGSLGTVLGAGILAEAAFLGAGTLILQIVAIVFLFWFIRMALKFRRTLVNSLDQMAEAVISKFILGTAQHTGALRGSEMQPHAQMGVMPERTMAQRAGDTMGNVARTGINAAQAVGHGAAAVALLSAGNPMGVGEAKKAADAAKATGESAKDTASSSTSETRTANAPSARGGSDTPVQGIEMSSSFQQASDDGGLQITDGTKDPDNTEVEVKNEASVSDRVPKKDSNVVQPQTPKTDAPQSNPADEGSGSGGTPMSVSETLGRFQAQQATAASSQAAAGGMRIKRKDGSEIEIAGAASQSTSVSYSNTSGEGGHGIVGSTPRVSGGMANQTIYDRMNIDHQQEVSETFSSSGAPSNSRPAQPFAHDDVRYSRFVHKDKTEIRHEQETTFVGGGETGQGALPSRRKPPLSPTNDGTGEKA